MPEYPVSGGGGAGTQGPAGPAGPAGAAGATGAQGPPTTSVTGLTGGTITSALVVQGALSTTPVTLTDGASIALNAAASDYFRVTLAGNRTLASPSSPTDGQAIVVEVIQDSTGSRTLAYGTAYSFPSSIGTPVLSSSPGARDYLAFRYEAATSLWYCAGFVPSQVAASLLAIGQGGTGQSSQAAALTALSGTQAAGQYVRSDGTNAALAAIQAADLPLATTSTRGALVLDGTASDILPVGTSAVAGSKGQPADASHVHKGFFGGVFGTGNDGAITFDGTSTVLGLTPSGSTYTLNRDIHCTSITVNSGVTLKTNNSRVFCRGTITNNGTISNNGNNASGSAGGAVSVSNSFGGGRAGGAGGTGVNGAGGAGTTVVAGTASGAGGAGTSGTGGAGQTPVVSQATLLTQCLQTPTAILLGLFQVSLNSTAIYGGGSSAGGGGSDASSNAGGGGGAGSGAIALLAYAVVNNGTISAAGGNGANGTGGNAGGGGGAGGGLIIAYTLSAWTAGTTTVTGGTAGSGSGTGSNGTAGSSGTVANVVLG